MDGISQLLVEVAAGGEDRFQQAVWVVIEEQEPGNWSLGAHSPELEASRQKRGTGKS
ncbi:4-oxalocrotonate tautomerase [Endozoicomonas sp. ONNA2]|uniref:tautomerase family protein n=1 Tax=Endozoicomonas sp. ONNA2 TaxID=2828741 RepID=UPI00214834C4|nr:4-oxalocrotonate tautomerase [Endozoicomonas sp. ONNA2]